MSLKAIKRFGPSRKIPATILSGQSDARRLLHIGIHNSANQNTGDTVLFPVVRRAFEELLGPVDWELRQAWELFTADDADDANQRFDGIVIGGGGLLLRDQAGSNVINSGWQWNSPLDALEKVQIPVIVFAVGYNRFRNQDDFDPVFSEHIQTLTQKSIFFGLRNTGSIKAVENYLRHGQSRQLSRQFCPTTLLWQLYPEYRTLAEQHNSKGKRVLSFNAAFDRSVLRFGENPEMILNQVARAVCVAADRGWQIVVTAHKTMDRDIEPYLDRLGVDYDAVDLSNASAGEAMKFYAEIDFAVGMRGHAQMIPFGLRKPIFSIISHDKMTFFLEDIGHPEWGVEVGTSDLPSRLEATLMKVESNRDSAHAEVAAVQQQAWEETITNLGLIESALSRHHLAVPEPL